MKELIEVIAKSLVDHPSEVVVTETVSGDDRQMNRRHFCELS